MGGGGRTKSPLVQLGSQVSNICCATSPAAGNHVGSDAMPLNNAGDPMPRGRPTWNGGPGGLRVPRPLEAARSVSEWLGLVGLFRVVGCWRSRIRPGRCVPNTSIPLQPKPLGLPGRSSGPKASRVTQVWWCWQIRRTRSRVLGRLVPIPRSACVSHSR